MPLDPYRMKYYGLFDMDYEGLYKQPALVDYHKEHVLTQNKAYLENLVPNYYKVISNQAMPREKAEQIIVCCPFCKSEMKRIFPVKSETELGMFTCTKCKRD